jgi:uncharacterized protein YlxW (UPF0749 family)
MTEPTYSIKEIIEIQFQSVTEHLKRIEVVLKDQNTQTEKQFARLDKEIADLRTEVGNLKTEQTKNTTKGNVIWGGLSVAGAFLISYIMNRIF